MTDAFQPRNELEQRFMAAQNGEISSDEFFQELLEAQVFMPVLDDDSGIKGFQRSQKATPLTIEDEEGTRFLVLFTSPERAKPFLTDFPGYEGGLLAEFKWVLEKMGIGLGVVINPGDEVGLDMAPEMVRQLSGQ